MLCDVLHDIVRPAIEASDAHGCRKQTLAEVVREGAFAYAQESDKHFGRAEFVLGRRIVEVSGEYERCGLAALAACGGRVEGVGHGCAFEQRDDGFKGIAPPAGGRVRSVCECRLPLKAPDNALARVRG